MIAEPLLNTYPKSRHERVRLSSWAVLQSVATQNSAAQSPRAISSLPPENAQLYVTEESSLDASTKVPVPYVSEGPLIAP